MGRARIGVPMACDSPKYGTVDASGRMKDGQFLRDTSANRKRMFWFRVVQETYGQRLTGHDVLRVSKEQRENAGDDQTGIAITWAGRAARSDRKKSEQKQQVRSSEEE